VGLPVALTTAAKVAPAAPAIEYGRRPIITTGSQAAAATSGVTIPRAGRRAAESVKRKGAMISAVVSSSSSG
jgi:hypothetical protein